MWNYLLSNSIVSRLCSQEQHLNHSALALSSSRKNAKASGFPFVSLPFLRRVLPTSGAEKHWIPMFGGSAVQIKRFWCLQLQFLRLQGRSVKSEPWKKRGGRWQKEASRFISGVEGSLILSWEAASPMLMNVFGHGSPGAGANLSCLEEAAGCKGNRLSATVAAWMCSQEFAGVSKPLGVPLLLQSQSQLFFRNVNK